MRAAESSLSLLSTLLLTLLPTLLPTLLLALPGPARGSATEDMALDTVGLLRKYGYGGEDHDVTTRDGFVLRLHRAPRSPRHPPGLRDPDDRPMPVFLQHGLLSSSADWVVLGPQRGLAYLLADAGYDVWMGNARGNYYSRRHVNLRPSDPDFWRFSFHEIGLYDLSSSIDYVLQRTGHRQLIYVGHSMGTTSFFVLCAERPEYNSKVRAMFAFAPVARLSNLDSVVLRMLARAHKPLAGFLHSIGAHELLPNSKMRLLGARTLCTKDSIFQSTCKRLALWLLRNENGMISDTMLPLILSHTPAGGSAQCLEHFAQIVSSDEFRKYDYGPKRNTEIYGQPTPPAYDLKHVTAPVFLHWSRNDPLANFEDVVHLHKELPDSQGMFEVPDKNFTHLDFIFSHEAKMKLYDKVIKQMRNYLIDYRLEVLLSRFNVSMPPR